MQAKHPHRYESISFATKDPCTYEVEDNKINIVAFFVLFIIIFKRLKMQPGMVVHAYKPSTWEVEAGRPEVHSGAIWAILRPCF